MLTTEQFLEQLEERKKTVKVAQIAEELCVSVQAVYQWMNGTNKPSNMVLRLAEQRFSDG